MSSARYAPLPNPTNPPDADRELDEAFESDDELDQDHSESTPLVSSRPRQTPLPTPQHSAHTPRSLSVSIPTPVPYDFERDYDYDRPPPGSPPSPSSVAQPNDIGNSNGLLPTSPVQRRVGNRNRAPFFRRVFGALLPQHYTQVPLDDDGEGQLPGRRVGGGIENDGVFANVMAKPGRSVAVRDTSSGEVHLVPEEASKDAPPVSGFLVMRLFVELSLIHASCPARHILRLKQTQYLNIGRRQSMHLSIWTPMPI